MYNKFVVRSGILVLFVGLVIFYASSVGAERAALLSPDTVAVQQDRVEDTARPEQVQAAVVSISEVHPSGSGNASYAADWFEISNTGTTDLNITGWRMDDSSNAFATAVPLRGVTVIPAGRSAIFFEGTAAGTTDAAITAAFSTAWFGSATPPAGVLIGAYGGSGVGLGTGGDAVNLFAADGTAVTGVAFGSATANATFDNTGRLATVTALSVAGVNGAFLSSNGAETGSPGRRQNATPLTSIDLSQYIIVGRYDLPEPTRTTAPPNNLLAQEVSGVTYNWDTDTLFVVGDSGTSVTQVTKTGQLIDTMTLAQGSSPQGTEFYDPEGITYIGNGKFVMTEERDRRVVQFTYVPGTTLTRAAAQTVTLGTFVQNIGLEGLTYDPTTAGFIVAKEIDPQGIFQTTVDFAAGTASNGSASTVNSINLFDPALMGLLDVADVYAMSNIPTLTGADSARLLVLSHESGKILNISRTGVIANSLTIRGDVGNPLTVPAQQHEGLTVDFNGNLYVVSENGGGGFDFPQLWVYQRSTAPNQPPTMIALNNPVASIIENTNTTAPVKVADIAVTDDQLGANNLTITGPDAAFFQITGFELFIRAGTVLDFETRSSYSITVNVDDPTVGATPDASVNYTLNIIDQVNETPVLNSLIISEVAPWSSGNSPVQADWFEVTNTSANPITLTGWKVDDSSNSFTAAVNLAGITTIGPGESVIFLESSTTNGAALIASFRQTWFGTNPPAGLQIGTYTGSGIGLSTGGDALNLYNPAGELQANVVFGVSPAGPSFPTFNNAVGLNNTNISTLSAVGVNGAFIAANDPNEIGSPGTVGRLIISEVAPWSSGNSPVQADWFEVTNTKATAVDITGWKFDDSSGSPVAAVALLGITSIAPGESVIFLESSTPDATAATFRSNWFGMNPPAGLKIGGYTGGGVGLSTGGDAVNLYNAAGVLQASVLFGASPAGPAFPTFDNAAGLNNVTISQLSAVGVNGAFVAANSSVETGSPGRIVGTGPTPTPTPTPSPTPPPVTPGIRVTEVAPWASGNSPVAADWFELTNTGSTAVNITNWRVDDSSAAFASAVVLNGITSIAPGESVIFVESATPATIAATFRNNWFGTNPPANLQIGTYTGSGIGLGTGGDEVNIFNEAGVVQARVIFGASPAGPAFPTFDNAAGLNNATISQLSAVGVNGAFVAVNSAVETGSPGRIAGATPTQTPSPTPPLPTVRALRVVNAAVQPGQSVTVSVVLDSLGNESSASFSLNFNPAIFTNPTVAIGNGTPAGANLGTNLGEAAQGRIGILVDSTNAYAAGTRQVVTVTFAVPAGVTIGTYPITFGSIPTGQSVSSTQGALLTTTYTAGNVQVGSTASGVEVSGRVTAPDGRGLRNAQVTIVDVRGFARTVSTGSFGYYRFEDVEAGSTLVVGVTSKRYRFTARLIQVVDTLADIDFVAMD